MTELTPKQVLENFVMAKAHAADHFEVAIREALKAAESVPLCSQYEVVKPLLEQALADYGERDE